MKALFLTIGLSLALALPTQAATPEEDLYHWGECAVAGGIYGGAVERGTSNASIISAFKQFEVLAPRMEKHVDAIADGLGNAKAAPVLEKLKADYTVTLASWDKQGDPADFFVKAFGQTMDRCLTEAATLPEA